MKKPRDATEKDPFVFVYDPTTTLVTVDGVPFVDVVNLRYRPKAKRRKRKRGAR